ncbi:FAD-binding oxidoreductase [Roseococcus suduntuyensis]|uniref:D-lactate dehydrogenase (cytochrome) n=1 Tax=Roseococcus suduntuyensis TaxID=455361 RepID=A0A840A9W8_9PROT|nr:FAD-linked oxidase C-terminal domain-containing protein [Roseococcus suduntuyensis]MBB3897104.1 D-lactate dehydrogenase (cytochrome) [Roseococcus suduntuyensis]
MNTLAPRAHDHVITAARAFLGERITLNDAIRQQHSRGEDTTPPTMPDAVVFAETTEEVSRLLALCHQHGVPVTPFGAGTSLEGHVNPVRGGISLDLSRMNAIEEVNAADMDCLIGPGVTRQQLNEYLRDQGLFFPVDPGSHCTIGGMCATRASGTNAVRYGTIRENVLGLEVVLADGRVVQTGGRTRKAANGYDLTRLFIGSEGTLGVITRIRLRLHGIPEATSAAVCQFPDLASAVNTVIATMQLGVPVARIELLDEVQMAACIAYSKLEGLAPVPTLFLEFHGTEAGVAEQAESVEALATDHGGSGFAWARDAEARNKLWKARHDAYWAGIAWRPGKRGITTDVCVPISRLAEALLGAKADIEASGFEAPIVGHVGDGNFHTIILVEEGNAEEMERAWALDRQIVRRALALGGTCSGEHGVGLGKREFLREEHGEAALSVMRALKASMDPKGILNPGKMFLDTNT